MSLEGFACVSACMPRCAALRHMAPAMQHLQCGAQHSSSQCMRNTLTACGDLIPRLPCLPAPAATCAAPPTCGGSWRCRRRRCTTQVRQASFFQRKTPCWEAMLLVAVS